MAEETVKWTNLPEAPPELGPGLADLARLAALCPHGWIELLVEQGRTPSTPDSAPEDYQDVQAICVWGVGPDIAERLDELLDEMVNDGSALSRVPASQFIAIARVCQEREEGTPGWSIALDVGWGVGGTPVYTLGLESVDDAPVVCGGCYAVGAEPHAGYCIDAEIEAQREEERQGADLLDEGEGEEADHV